jgi:membrane-associated phospholipid phosphatase
MAFGHDPGTLLHDLLGTGVSAHVLSTVYVFFLLFVPLSLGVAVVWQRKLHRGLWYVTAMNFAWLMGLVSYYALPSLGPVFVAPDRFAGLPDTGVSQLQQTLLENREAVLASPHRAEDVQSIAAFASLHVAIVLAAALIAQLLGLRRVIRVSLWSFLALTTLATIYFGWHYVVDDVAGAAIGIAAVVLGAAATGHELRPARRRPQVMVSGPKSAGAAEAT